MLEPVLTPFVPQTWRTQQLRARRMTAALTWGKQMTPWQTRMLTWMTCWKPATSWLTARKGVPWINKPSYVCVGVTARSPKSGNSPRLLADQVPSTSCAPELVQPTAVSLHVITWNSFQEQPLLAAADVLQPTAVPEED